MGQTIIEKIISNHSSQRVTAGDIAIVDVDLVMATDTTGPLTIKAFENMGGTKIWDPTKMVLVIDHASPAPNEGIAVLHDLMRKFATEQNIKLYDVGDGICHQLIIENQHVKPGQLVLGADSHTCTYGAIGTFSTGVGSTDLAGAMLTGKTWLKVPETIKINITGTLQEGVVAKDLILYLVGILGIQGATYQAIEFTGEVIERMTLESRMVLANMVIEMGAKAGLVDLKGLDLPYDYEILKPDEDANYTRIIDIDVSDLEMQVAAPHSPDNIKGISEIGEVQIQQAFIGSCTNGRLEDLHVAADILKGKKVHPKVRFIIAPASRQVFQEALADGTIEILSAAGASFLPSGCGPCVGTHQGIPGNGENVASSTNRNFQGRMGNHNSNVYLGSPAFVATAALHGKIVNHNLTTKEAIDSL
ncbi:3-isopropylmalate dehydratase large subunit [Sporosarcina sp. GW1-11]|uniref:3-isopropylmalate dehydratase large subunit n=1 Tax=Sporosarcina sp. GW1-11 TaxID=2899126 RepID=UPI00294E9E29|nr:3-isopropylmalate dehydratase large subunit [Sporosarcina sp. GW1-11]MDV6378655.1 3-isopropylmalate dehydratase large subunit [Sporosarcina sp. GW1-11]